MPWRLLGFIVFLGTLLVFMCFNLNNSCDISFGFTTIPAVPVYLTAFSAFVLGLLCALPLILALRFKKKKAKAPPSIDAGGVKQPGFGKKRSRKKADPPADGFTQDTVGGGPYGIN